MKKSLLLLLLFAISFSTFSAEKPHKNEIKITYLKNGKQKKVKKFKKEFMVVHVSMDYYCPATGETLWFRRDFSYYDYPSLEARQVAIDQYAAQLNEIANFLAEGCPTTIY